MSDKSREAFINAGYWPNVVMWECWSKAFDLGCAELAADREKRDDERVELLRRARRAEAALAKAQKDAAKGEKK